MMNNLSNGQGLNQVQVSVEAFRELLTEGVSPEEIKQVFCELYFSYSQLVIRHPDDSRYDHLEQLYYLTRIIDLLGNKNQTKA